MEMFSGRGIAATFRRFCATRPAITAGRTWRRMITGDSAQWAEVTSDGWLRDARQHHQVVRCPDHLTFPLPDDAFRGYVEAPPAWVPAGVEFWTHPLVVLVSKGATVILAISSGVQVASRRDVAPIYADKIGGRWAGFVTDIDRVCRSEWGYEVPQDHAERARLQAWCDLALEFEQDCLAAIEAAKAPTNQES